MMARMPRRLSYRQELVEAIAVSFPPTWFSRWSKVHGNAQWTPQKILWTLLLMSWDEAPTLNQRFENTLRLLKLLRPRWKLPKS
jgi:hypothetical protein